MNGADDSKALICGAVCAAPILAIAPDIAPATLVRAHALVTLPELLISGRSPPPEPYPPKPFRTD
jgi:hypothetical protein